jgi:hypothetical protein
MKSFKQFLLEGQAEIDSAIRKMEDIERKDHKLWDAANRLIGIVYNKTKPIEGESDSEQDARSDKIVSDVAKLRHKKSDKRFKPEVKQLMKSLSPEDVRGFLISPDEQENEGRAYHGYPTDRVVLDRFAGPFETWGKFTRMVPPDALRDVSDIMTVVRAKDETSESIARNLQKDSKIKPKKAEFWHGIPNKVVGGTFHERKALRKARQSGLEQQNDTNPTDDVPVYRVKNA